MRKRKPAMSVMESSHCMEEDRLPVADTQARLDMLLSRAWLTPIEEKVIRMHRGILVDDDRQLGLKTDDPLVLQQLAEIELLAYRQITQPADDTPRSRIISRLQGKR